MRQHVLAAITAAGLLGLGTLALAQGTAEPQRPQDQEGFPLSLADCLRRALENNLDLVSARTDPAISREAVIGEEAAFDWGLSYDQEHSESQQEISNLFSLTDFKQDNATMGVNKRLEFGADYTIGFDVQRSEATGPFVTTETTYGAGLGVTFNLPLLGVSNGRTAGRLATTERLVLAQSNLEISQETLRTEAQQVIEAAENAYWNVVANGAALRTRQLALKRAQDLLALNRKKVEVGTLAPIEITQAEAGVASNEELLIIAETDLDNSYDELRRLMNVPEDDPLWSTPIVATDRPDFTPRAISLEESLSAALANRPDLIAARRTLRNEELSERVARKQTKPGMGLVAQLRPEGNNFEGVTTISSGGDISIEQETEGTIGEAVSEIPDFDNYSWSLAFNVTYPIGNRAAEANYATASLNRQKAETAVANQEQLALVEVRRSVRAVESGAKRFEAATKNVELQTKKLDAEQKKFENGMSTSFEVLTFQNDLADSELARIQAGLDYVRALAALERSKGTLLAARNLTLDTDTAR